MLGPGRRSSSGPRRPLHDQLTFKLREHSADLSHRPSVRSREVDLLSDSYQPHLPRPETFEQG